MLGHVNDHKKADTTELLTPGKKGQFRKAKAAANGNGYLESYISSKLIYKICTLTLFL